MKFVFRIKKLFIHLQWSLKAIYSTPFKHSHNYNFPHTTLYFLSTAFQNQHLVTMKNKFLSLCLSKSFAIAFVLVIMGTQSYSQGIDSLYESDSWRSNLSITDPWMIMNDSVIASAYAVKRVGIGTSLPECMLTVNGKMSMRFVDESPSGAKQSYICHNGANLVIGSLPGSCWHNSLELIPGGCPTTTLWSQLNLYNSQPNQNPLKIIHISTHGDNWFNIDGNFGIGESTPQYKLDVAGTIRADEIIVTSSGADFVFEQDYALPSLDSVATYINEKKHLPGIPSAATMSKDGVALGEYQTALLQKIEELTLYILEQQNQINDLQKQINQSTMKP